MMNNENKFKFRLMEHIQTVFIATYVVFSIGVLILMVLNHGSAENYDLLKPIAGGMFIALFFVVTSFLAPLEIIEETTPVAVLSRQERYVSFPYLSMYDEPGYGYTDMATLTALLQTKGVDIKPVEGRQYLTELIELKTVLWIASQYRQHWQVQREWFSGFSGGGGSSRVAPDADKRTMKVRIADLLSDNMYAAKAEEISADHYIYLPEGTKGTYDREKHLIEFDNAHMNMKITFRNVGGSALGAGVEAEKLKSNLQEEVYGRIWAGHFTVNFKITPKRLRRWSPSTKKQIVWAKDLVAKCEQAFSFSVLKQLIKEKL